MGRIIPYQGKEPPHLIIKHRCKQLDEVFPNILEPNTKLILDWLLFTITPRIVTLSSIFWACSSFFIGWKHLSIIYIEIPNTALQQKKINFKSTRGKL